jgi:O-antigen/teichoic acid export membrane protein
VRELALVSIVPLVALLPLLSRFFLGSPDAEFVLFGALIALGSFVNVLSGPAYYALLGRGTTRPVVHMHVLHLVLVVVLAVALGWLWGATGVVAGGAIALAASSLVVLLDGSVVGEESEAQGWIARPAALWAGALAAALAVFVQAGAGWWPLPVATLLVSGTVLTSPLRDRLLARRRA